MKLLFDHGVPDDTAYGLSAQGHEVFRLRYLIDPRTSDEEVLRYAAANEYVLITCNRDDFLEAAKNDSSFRYHNIVTSDRARSRTRGASSSARQSWRTGNPEKH